MHNSEVRAILLQRVVDLMDKGDDIAAFTSQLLQTLMQLPMRDPVIQKKCLQFLQQMKASELGHGKMKNTPYDFSEDIAEFDPCFDFAESVCSVEDLDETVDVEVQSTSPKNFIHDYCLEPMEPEPMNAVGRLRPLRQMPPNLDHRTFVMEQMALQNVFQQKQNDVENFRLLLQQRKLERAFQLMEKKAMQVAFDCLKKPVLTKAFRAFKVGVFMSKKETPIKALAFASWKNSKNQAVQIPIM